MNFEIAPKETEAKFLTWGEAMLYCQFLNYDGGGWRLPNKDELNYMYLTKTDDMKNVTYYWSCTVDENDDENDKVWIQNFKTGYRFTLNKDDEVFVRAIRDIS